MKNSITKLPIISMMVLCLGMALQINASAFTDAQVQAMSADDVHKLTAAQIKALTSTQISIISPNLIWCPNGLIMKSSPDGGSTYCTKKDNPRYVEPLKTLVIDVTDNQILGMTKAQLLALPLNLYSNLDKNAIVYALAHNN